MENHRIQQIKLQNCLIRKQRQKKKATTKTINSKVEIISLTFPKRRKRVMKSKLFWKLIQWGKARLVHTTQVIFGHPISHCQTGSYAFFFFPTTGNDQPHKHSVNADINSSQLMHSHCQRNLSSNLEQILLNK